MRAIRSQTVLAAEDLTLAEATRAGRRRRDRGRGRPGGAGRRSIPGRPILASQLGAPALVERNQLVRMTYAEGALRIATEGRALDRAGAGEPVRVMNLASRQTVTGTVAPDGSIEVGQ